MSTLQETASGAPRHGGAIVAAATQYRRARVASDRAGERGFVKRHEGFDQVLAKAQRFTGTHHAKIVMLAAIRSMPGLTPAEEKVLSEAVDIIHKGEYQSGTAGILTARNTVFADRCALTMERVKVARRGLERKGLAIRHIAGDNNASHFDIRPFLADIDTYIEHRVALDEARHEADRAGDGFVTLGRMKNTPRGVEDTPHIQSSRTASGSSVPANAGEKGSAAKAAEESIPGQDAPRGRSLGRRRAGPGSGTGEDSPAVRWAGKSGKCSQGGASVGFGVGFEGSGGPELALPQLLRVFELSPRWREVVDIEDVRRLAFDRLFAGTAEMIRRHYPDPKRNHGDTWSWGMQRHGWRAILMAVIAIEDPKAIDPGKYLGGFVRKGAEWDLSLNLEWIVAHREEQLQQLAELELNGDEGGGVGDQVVEDAGGTEPGGHDQVEQLVVYEDVRAAREPGPIAPEASDWPRFLEILRARAGVSLFVFKQQMGQIGFVDFREEWLILSAPSDATKAWVRDNYERHMLKLARDWGWPVRSVRYEVST